VYQVDESGRCVHGHEVTAMSPCDLCPRDDDAGVGRPSRVAADEDEQLARTVRDEILELARQYKDQRDENESKDRIGFSTVAKLYDTALKWHNAATRERSTRDDKAFAEWLVEEKRRLIGRGASH
jgi:hypothetical protein